jgi:hypothetical protein
MVKHTSSLKSILTALSERNGGKLTPQIVLDEATHKRSPLHPYFEWDDSVAATAHRLKQAGDLIRTVRITFGENTSQTFRAFVSVTPLDVEEKKRIYVPIATAWSVPSYKEQVLANAMQEAQVYVAKYAALKEIEPVIEAMRKVGWPNQEVFA